MAIVESPANHHQHPHAPSSYYGAPAAGPSGYLEYPKRHPWEIGLLVLVIFSSVVLYLLAFAVVLSGKASFLWLSILATPAVLYLMRGLNYGQQRTNGVKMSPTQFPDGYWLVVEAAQRFGLSEVPDAYVVLGNGLINAFASGHGFRRYVVVYSDLFEIGGQARDPEALAFVIGHEVGHIAAGHASYWRQLSQLAMKIPFLGATLSRSMEYTADNYGYAFRPSGAARTIGVLSAGKYLLRSVSFDGMADRAGSETGFFVWLANMLASHPVNTWRAAALRNRAVAGSLFFRPRQAAPIAPPAPWPPAQNAGWMR
ncbi:M48 family metallopeptidase [Mycobacterium angelicum]|uniref:Peptidase M48 n=1 Tax=Mycobacterium angelicum TaxID=470074 RepID=A0A1X0A6R4_MYCAN|nr:M48 family metallopeptidase [Mycobacterium angelicum]MCV7194929.1 M48 family metallopeptidase [Mycobacterium angelicum]ORA25769.1 peptidase M48 [Mycobacterium angelicum]